jgi:hypothetical protein
MSPSLSPIHWIDLDNSEVLVSIVLPLLYSIYCSSSLLESNWRFMVGIIGRFNSLKSLTIPKCSLKISFVCK